MPTKIIDDPAGVGRPKSEAEGGCWAGCWGSAGCWAGCWYTAEQRAKYGGEEALAAAGQAGAEAGQAGQDILDLYRKIVDMRTNFKK